AAQRIVDMSSMAGEKYSPDPKCLGDALVNFVEDDVRDLVVLDSGHNRGQRGSGKVAADRRGIGQVLGDRQCHTPHRRKLQQETPVRGRGHIGHRFQGGDRGTEIERRINNQEAPGPGKALKRNASALRPSLWPPSAPISQLPRSSRAVESTDESLTVTPVRSWERR